jgi:hypothetical protein
MLPLLTQVALAQISVPTPDGSVSFTGYAEVYAQVNTNRPSNGVTNLRGFDNRAGTFTLANVAAGAAWDVQNVVGKVMFQVGHTADSYYAAEPSLAGGTGANATGAPLWRFIQQAQVGYRIAPAHGLTLDAGVFLSPIGPEGMAVRDNWNFSRSNLFFGLPFYHTGARATLPAGRWAITLGVWNGWNSVVDNNPGKSISLQASYTRDDLLWSLLYMGGNERPAGAAEGKPWRNTVDSHLTWHATPWFSLLVHANGGGERNRIGTSAWAAGAVYARLRLHPLLRLSARGDLFREWTARDGDRARRRSRGGRDLLARALGRLGHGHPRPQPRARAQPARGGPARSRRRQSVLSGRGG